MKRGTSCFEPLDVQRHELSGYLMELCAGRAVDPGLAEDVIAALDRLDRSSFAGIQRSTLERFPDAGRDNSYLDVCHHVSKAMRLYLTFIVGNRKTRPIVGETRPHRRILDIGSGSGSFSFLCNALGHRATGLERPRDEQSDPTTPLKYLLSAWYGVGVIEHEIAPQAPFPLADRSFDDFVIFYPTFHRSWNERDWRFLFSDLARCATKDRSRLYLKTSKPKVKDGGVTYFSHDGFSRAVATVSHHVVGDRSYVVDLG